MVFKNFEGVFILRKKYFLKEINFCINIYKVKDKREKLQLLNNDVYVIFKFKKILLSCFEE